MMVLLGASRSMAMQSAKMRIPSIKFRHGRQADNQTAPSSSPAKQQVFSAARVTSAPTALQENQLPARFCRQAISEEEIEYINRGGPA